MTPTALIEKFTEIHGMSPRLFRAPGRVNLIGEHTDYNDGFVMPAAIQFATWIAAAARSDRRLHVFSGNFSEGVEFDLDEPSPQGRRHWSDYVRGVAVILEKAGHRLRGANLAIQGEVPIGSGLSSSAAIEVSTALALTGVADLEISRVELALLCQRAENEFVGMRCGIMDQLISCQGQKDHALVIDCRSLGTRAVPLPASVRLVVCNTMVKHELAAGEYNRRREECEAGAAALRARFPEVQALRDATLEQLEQCRTSVTDAVFRRCRHVISEDTRVERAAAALERGNVELFGKWMDESHRSLRDDYEVSCQELDLMVELASKLPGVYGSRMTGGGFGGCTVNLVDAELAGAFASAIATAYSRATGIAPAIYTCVASQGAEEILASVVRS